MTGFGSAETAAAVEFCAVRDGLGSAPSKRREVPVSARDRRRHSIVQRLALAVGRPHGGDIEALTESTGAGRTVHGDFLFAEVIDDGQEDR